MGKSALVLIVEDSPTQAQKIQAVLCSYQLRVAVATDGLQALSMVDDEQPDLVVLDVNLPKMVGYQVCNRLKRDNTTAHIPVIMLTPADSADATLRGLELGADDFIPKDDCNNPLC